MQIGAEKFSSALNNPPTCVRALVNALVWMCYGPTFSSNTCRELRLNVPRCKEDASRYICIYATASF